MNSNDPIITVQDVEDSLKSKHSITLNAEILAIFKKLVRKEMVDELSYRAWKKWHNGDNGEADNGPASTPPVKK
jgi:hypothetical protein